MPPLFLCLSLSPQILYKLIQFFVTTNFYTVTLPLTFSGEAIKPILKLTYAGVTMHFHALLGKKMKENCWQTAIRQRAGLALIFHIFPPQTFPSVVFHSSRTTGGARNFKSSVGTKISSVFQFWVNKLIQSSNIISSKNTSIYQDKYFIKLNKRRNNKKYLIIQYGRHPCDSRQ